MNIFKAIFGGKELTAEEEKQERMEKNFDLLKYDGVKAVKIGQMDYAVKCFTEALKLKDDLEIHDYLSRAYISQGMLPEALQQLELLATAKPDNQDVLLQMANVAYMMEDYDLMTTICDRAMAINTDNEHVIFFAARACVGKGDTTQALALLDKAIELRDDYADARLLRGRVLMDEKRMEEADADADWLMEYAGGHEDVIMFKAQLEASKGKKEEARQLYDSVLDINPFSAQAYMKRGALLLEMGLEAEAESDFQQARELNPEQDNEDIERQVQQAYKNASPFGI